MRKTCLSFNNAIRRVIDYRVNESVKKILYFFDILPYGMLMEKLEINFIASCLQSNRKMLNMCANLWLHSNKRLILMQKYDFNSFDRSQIDVQM